MGLGRAHPAAMASAARLVGCEVKLQSDVVAVPPVMKWTFYMLIMTYICLNQLVMPHGLPALGTDGSALVGLCYTGLRLMSLG